MDEYQIWENKYKNKLNFDKNKFKIIAKIKCRRNTMEEDVKIIEEWCEREEKIIKFTDNEELKKYGKMMIKALVNVLAELENQKDYYETRLQEENQRYEELLEQYNEMRW